MRAASARDGAPSLTVDDICDGSGAQASEAWIGDHVVRPTLNRRHGPGGSRCFALRERYNSILYESFGTAIKLAGHIRSRLFINYCGHMLSVAVSVKEFNAFHVMY
jgi:hypothetical protein